jgi:hypothetical protein
MTEQSRQVRKVADEHDVLRFSGQRINDPRRWVVRLQAASGREARQGTAVFPEALGGLTGSQLSAVPDDGGLYAAGRRVAREEIDRRAAGLRKRSHGIDIRANRIAVMDEVEHG